MNAVEQVERLLPELYGRWRSQLRRHPQLAASHDDILQLTAQDLLAAVRTRSEPLELDRLRRLGFAILKRRVADAYRSQVRRWARDEPLEDQQVARDVNTDPARVAYFAILLRSVVALMADMDIRDRELLLRSLDDDATTEPMTDAERKRLSRARERLRLLIDKKHN